MNPFKIRRAKPSDPYIRVNPLVPQTSPLYENRDQTGDVTFKIEGEEISAHQSVLAAISPKYKRQFHEFEISLYGDSHDNDKKVIELNPFVNEPCVSVEAFEEFLQFFYLNKVKLSDENIDGVIFLAKDSLVPEFYNECTQFLVEALSIENVCQSYRLAILHNCDDLLEICEREIKSNFKEVLTTNGFKNYNRGMLSKVLQLVPANYEATEVFEACISWAEHVCAESNLEAKNTEHLRRVLGDILCQISFKTMTFEEFKSLRQSYGSLFRERSMDEIDSPFDAVNTLAPARCQKFLYPNYYKTSVSFDHHVLLNAFFFASLSQNYFTPYSIGTEVKVEIIEKEPSSSFDNSDGKTLFSETRQIKLHKCKSLPCANFFGLQERILIKPHHIYDISTQFQRDVCLSYSKPINERTQSDGVTLKCYTVGPIECLWWHKSEQNENFKYT